MLSMMPTPAAAPGMTPQNDLHGRWMTYLENPQIRAAMMQFGIGMLQPRTNGQTLMGQVGQSIGEAGQAAGRVQTSQLEIGQQARLEARDQARLENEQAGVRLEGERNQIARDQAANTARQTDAQIAASEAQTALDREGLEVDKFKAKSLDFYYKSLASAANVKAAPPGYKEALNALKESSLFTDDPVATFIAGLPAINQQFGMGGTAAVTPPAGAAAPATPPAPTPGVEPPADAVNLLRGAPTPENKQYFDQVFGPGAADRALKAQ